MSQILRMDALVTVLACLTSTQDDKISISVNSRDAFSLPNTANESSCPLSTLSGMNARIQNLVSDNILLQENLNKLQDQMLTLLRGRSSLRREIEPVAESRESYIPNSCRGQEHGIVRIKLNAESSPILVNCDQETRNGSWLIIAKRDEGDEDFYRKWLDYKIGFGNRNRDFFIGLDNLHTITTSYINELIIVMRNRQNEERFAMYDQFSIGDESEKYIMNVLGVYSGDAGESLRYHAGKKFTTYDQDNDENGANCAKVHSGAWWYGRDCYNSNLFGLFQRKFERDVDEFKGILWKNFLDGPKGSLKAIKMMVRPRN